jgi:outer membrane immunogenic protein
MKKLIWAGAALAAFTVSESAGAADVNAAATRNAAPVLAPSWTGFYAGLGLGLRASRTDATTTSETVAGIAQNLSDGRPLSKSFDGTGFRVNPYAGYLWQFAPRWVAGIEGDVGFADQTETRHSIALSPGSVFFLRTANTLAVRTGWDGGLRSRVGFLLTPTTLAYATGGLAWQHYDVTSNCATLCVSNAVSPAVVSSSTTRIGWTVGGGLETALGGNWLLRSEYRYADFDAAPFTISRPTAAPATNPIVDKFDVAMRTHTALVGVAYKFGDPLAVEGADRLSAAPVVKAAPATMSWTGGYAGLGLGARASQSQLTATGATFGGTPLTLTSGDTVPFNGTAFRANPYVGINWQFVPRWIVGLESDAGFAGQTTTLVGLPFGPAFGTFSNAADSLTVKTKWDASLRARLGFLVTPATLLFASGGAAWQHYDVTSTCGSVDCRHEFDLSPAVITNSTTRTGWTAGGGVETALGGNWLARAEYRYADFGSTSYKISRFSSFAPQNTIENFDVTMRTHTASFGLAYKFN